MKFLLFSVLLFTALAFAAEIAAEDPVAPEDADRPDEISTALMAHVQENGLERVMRVKRYCGCCGGCCGCGCMCASMAPVSPCPCMGCCG